MVDEISGELGWQQRTIAVPAGMHAFRWQYSKYGSVSASSGMLWIHDPDARNLPMRFYRASEKP